MFSSVSDLVFFFAVLAEDAIKAALADYRLKQEGEKGEKIAVSRN